MRRRLSDAVDVVAMAAVAGGVGVRFGWWLAAVVAGTFVLIANNLRSS